MTFWNQKSECMHREELEQLQLERLQAVLNRVFKNVKHYRKLFQEMDFVSEDLRSLKDLRRLPFTSRRDMADNYPYGMFAVPLREVVRLLAPALIHDRPMVMGFTKNDLQDWAELVARNLTAVGVDKDDVVQLSLNLPVMTTAFGLHLGTELIGASILPLSGTNLRGQVQIMRDFRATALVATPSIAQNLIKAVEEEGMDPNSLSLKYGIFGAEPWSEALREQLEQSLHLTATDAYGITEIFGPGVAWECPEKNGLHLPEDHFIPEIINPKTLEPLPPGVEGELVITTISKEAYPLIRFRTGDITSLIEDTCSCGRTHRRIQRVFRRCDNILVIRGLSLPPEQIGRILTNISGDVLRYQIVVERREDMDHLEVLVEISEKIFFDKMKVQREFTDRLHQAVSTYLGFEVKIKLVEPKSFESEALVFDKRKIK